MIEFLTGSNGFLFVYYLLSNLIYLGLLITAIYSTVRHQRQLGLVRWATWPCLSRLRPQARRIRPRVRS